MTSTVTRTFTTDSNWTKSDSAKIGIVADEGTLKLQDNPGQEFTEDFSDDTDFIYNPSLVEFSGGKIQQKDQAGSMVLGAKFYSNEDASIGTAPLDGTLKGGAVISNNMLDCTSSFSDGCEFPGSIATIGQQYTIRFRYTHKDASSEGEKRKTSINKTKNAQLSS